MCKQLRKCVVGRTVVPQRSSHPNPWNLQMLPSMEEEKKRLQWGMIQVDPA